MRVRLFVAAAVVCGFALLTSSMGEAAAPTTHTVLMDGTAFTPPEMSIAAGDAIEWVNKDPFPHTATSEAGGFDSHTVRTGKSWKFTFKKKGDFPYVCDLHDNMTGTIHVK